MESKQNSNLKTFDGFDIDESDFRLVKVRVEFMGFKGILGRYDLIPAIEHECNYEHGEKRPYWVFRWFGFAWTGGWLFESTADAAQRKD